jgi:endonuclease YncB( thermonuclease family)
VSRVLRLTLLVIVAALAAPAAAPAASGPCVPEYPNGAQCNVWKGTVRSVNDGDTLDAHVPRDGLGGLLRIRIIGIQAMEQTSYRAAQRAGDCHAVDATDRLEGLVRRSKQRIRVASLYPESRSRGRRLRSVAVRYKGRWRDVGRIMITEGHALWLPGRSEDATNVRYSVLTQRAAAAGKGLFSANHCGIGPNEGHPIKLWVNWDADGVDSANPSGEWVKIRNLDPVNPVPLGDWYLRDAGLRRYVFPPQAVIQPGGIITVDVGTDGDDATVFPWGQQAPVFSNAGYGEDAMGDGAYLFDPLGNVRASMTYPCRTLCSDPLQGAVALSVDPNGRRESVTITNVTPGPIDLDGYVLKSEPQSYHFAPGSVLAPGGSMRIQVVGDSANDTATDKRWGFAKPILRDAGDVVKLLTYTDITLACTAWGDKSC